MKLTPKAAIEACEFAASQKVVVVRVEGGIWHAPGFEARVDCIWDGIDPPTTEPSAQINNRQAASFIREQERIHSAFVLTTAGFQGYEHTKPSRSANQ